MNLERTHICARAFAVLAVVVAAVFGPSVIRSEEQTDSVKPDAVADTLKMSVELGNIEVKAANVIHSSNKDTYIVTPEMKQGVYNAGQLLSRVNGVIYDPITKEISYNGSGNIVILLDSVPKSAQYIKKLSPDRFDRIEVINFPTGAYLGYDALINFHTRPAYQGYESNLMDQVYVVPGQRLGRGQWLNRNDAYGDLTFTHEKWNISAMVLPKYEYSVGSPYYSRVYQFNQMQESVLPHPRNHPSRRTRTNAWNGNFAIDYQISKDHSVSVQWNLDASDVKRYGDEQLEIRDLSTSQSETVSYHSLSHTHGLMRNNLGAYYRGRFGAWNVNVSANYAMSDWDNFKTVERSNGYLLNDDRRGDLDYVWGNVDISRFVGNNCVLSLSESATLSSYKERDYATDEMLTDNSIFYNNLILMAQYAPKRGLTLSLSGGMQAYRNAVAGQSITRFVPRAGAGVFWTATQNCVVRVNYDMSANMPPMVATVDYGQWTDAYMYQMGNPLLKPATLHRVDLNVTLANMVTLMAIYRNNRNEIYNIASLGEVDGTPAVFRRYENGTYDQLDLGVSFAKSLSDRFRLSVNASAQRAHASYGEQSRCRWMPKADAVLMYTDSKRGISGNFAYSLQRTLTALPQSIGYGNSEVCSIAIAKTLLKGRMELMLMYSLPIHFIKGNEYKEFMTSDAMTERLWNNSSYYRDNKLSFSISYRFSGGNQVRRYSRRTMNL